MQGSLISFLDDMAPTYVWHYTYIYLLKKRIWQSISGRRRWMADRWIYLQVNPLERRKESWN